MPYAAIFGLGPLELVIIIVVLIVFFLPALLPKILKRVGETFGAVKQMAEKGMEEVSGDDEEGGTE